MVKMKNNLYYYFFYRISIFIKRIGRKDNDYIESGCAFFTTCMLLNVLAGLFYFEHYFLISFVGFRIFIILLALLIWYINRQLLIKGDQKSRIFYFYDNIDNRFNFKDILLILYVVFSFAIPIIIAHQHRIGKW